MEVQRIVDALRRMGIGRQYLGYNIIIKAVRMVIADSNCLLCVKWRIFQPLAEAAHCDWRTIERNIRTAIRRAWKINKEYIIVLARYPMQQEPTVTEFLEILSNHAMQKRIM